MSIASSSSAQETEDFDLSEKDESWFVCLCFCCVGLAFGLLFPGVTSVKVSSGLVVMNSWAGGRMSSVYCASSGWIDCKRRVVCVVEFAVGGSQFLVFEGPGKFLLRGPSAGKVGSLLASVDIEIKFGWFVGWLLVVVGVRLEVLLFS